MTTPEGRVKNATSKLLKEFGAVQINNDVEAFDDDTVPDPELYYFMPVQSGLGKRTLDYLCCYRGHFIAIETKAPSKWLTGIQETTKRQMEAAGATVFVIAHHSRKVRGHPMADTLDELRDFLRRLRDESDADDDT